VVVERHLETLLDKEDYEAVVLWVLTCDGNPVEGPVKMVGIVGAGDAKLLGGNGHHSLGDFLAVGVRNSGVEEGAVAGSVLALQGDVLDWAD
jgi:hypothetical protein